MKVKSIEKDKGIKARDRIENAPGLDRAYKVLDNEFNEIIDCRVYFTRSFNTCTCCLWVHSKGIYLSGSGRAGGYGYDKRSAAIADAVYNAGIILDKHFDGAGDSAAENALMSIAKKVSGKRSVHLIKCHS